MTNQIAPLSKEKLLELFPNYFDAAVSGTWITISNLRLLRGDVSNNKLAGTTATENFEGRGGNDVITAGPAPSSSDRPANFGVADYGDDLLGGGSGADVLVGGQGDNTIFGGGGDDYLYGDQLRLIRSSDDPTIPPNAIPLETTSSTDDGNDLLFGGSGNDFLHGGGGDANFLRGARGQDTVIGDANSKRDVLIGNRGPNDDDNLSDYLKSGGAPFTTMKGGGGNDVFDIMATGPGDYVKILDFSDGDKIKLPPGDSIAVLYEMVRGESGVDWDWEWVATETDDGVTIPLDNGTLYLAGVEFDDLTITVDVSGGIFEMT